MPNAFSVKDWITQKKYVFPLLAFIIPFAIRTIPEVLIGPFIVGFDTMGFYVPNTLSWLHGGVDLWAYLSVAPLFYAVLMSATSTGLPIIIALKVISPVLLGVLGLSIYYYAHKGLGWSSVKSLAPALLGTLYFVALRVSWDMLRSELGLIFLFVALTLLSQLKGGSWKHYLLLSVTMLLVVLSHQLVSVIMFGVVLFTVICQIRNGASRAVRLLATASPAVVFFLLYFFSVAPAGFQDYALGAVSPLANWLGFSSYPAMLANEAGFFLYCFLPILPLALLSIKRLGDFQLRSWLLLSVILLLIPFAFVSPYRWLLLLTYPLAFYVTESLSRLKLNKWKYSKLTVRRIAVLYLILSTGILSLGFMLTPPERPFVYFDPKGINIYSYQIPTSMLQNTISVADFQSTTNVLRWFNDNQNSSAILLTHTAFHSWALLTLDNSTQIKYYEFGDPSTAAASAIHDGKTQVYLIWWVNGQGWYNKTSLPLSFEEVYHSGRIALYQYTAMSNASSSP